MRPAGASPELSDFRGGEVLHPVRGSGKEHPTATCIDEAIDLVALEHAAALVPVSVTSVQRRQDIVFVPVTDAPFVHLSLAWREGPDSARVRVAVGCAQDAARDPAVRALFATSGAPAASGNPQVKGLTWG